ncbi:Mannose-6-phosphate isomerase [Candidatus Burkholderia humilis]|nr:Mannose-6-phosphate isomerase [Candidatus Burkholderia humilis]
MKVIESSTLTADRAWGALDICVMNGTSCRLHWTDKPYKWHVNDGEEVFAVMQGEVLMHVLGADGERARTLKASDIFYAQAGDEHFAEPVGEARILVIEKERCV